MEKAPGNFARKKILRASGQILVIQWPKLRPVMENKESCPPGARAGRTTKDMGSLDSSVTEEMGRLHPESYGWAMACCRHDAEEAADTLQTVYLKVLQSQARFEGRGEFKTWLFGVIRRTASERRRQQWRRNLALLRFAESGISTTASASDPVIPSEHAASRERSDQFRALLNRLPERQRQVLHLIYYQQLSVSQAAEAMGISLGSARQHFDRAKKRLAQYWNGGTESPPFARTQPQHSATDGR